MKTRSLLIKLKDDKKFLTHEKNLIYLIEFAKTFEAEIYLVENEPNQKLFELSKIIKSFCDSEYKDNIKYKKIRKVFPK